MSGAGAAQEQRPATNTGSKEAAMACTGACICHAAADGGKHLGAGWLRTAAVADGVVQGNRLHDPDGGGWARG